MSKKSYQWARPGDVNAFFGLMLDNIANMVLCVGLLSAVFGFPVDFALKYMVPGTAIGVLVGDLLYFWLAFRLAKKTGRSDVTAMPLGLDTPSTFGMVFLVLGPAFATKLSSLAKDAGWTLDELRTAASTALEAGQTGGVVDTLQNLNYDAATFAWQIGICSIFVSGLLKFVLAFASGWIRKVVPRAGLLGSLAAIALILITFLPLEEICRSPLVGFASMILIFFTLIARGKLPGRLPGAFVAVLAGSAIYYLILMLNQSGVTAVAVEPVPSGSNIYWFPDEWLTVFNFEWFSVLGEAVYYFPYILPFAIGTVIGGIDCTESAASAGDDYNTSTIIGIEAFSTLVAALCGGVIQSTPYIGHPAYKAMGGRAAYVLATALFVGGAGLIGYFGLVNQYVPKAAVMPILLFVGIEITAQSFHVTPRRHYAALALACLPAMVKLVVLYIGDYSTPEVLAEKENWVALNAMAGGFVITSLIWASALSKIIDRRLVTASVYFAVAGLFVLFGIIHSPIDDRMFYPWQLGQVTVLEDGSSMPMFSENQRQIVIEYALAYLMMAAVLFGLSVMLGDRLKPIETDEEFEKLVD